MVKLWSPKPSSSVRFTYSLPYKNKFQKIGENIYKNTDKLKIFRVLIYLKIDKKMIKNYVDLKNENF